LGYYSTVDDKQKRKVLEIYGDTICGPEEKEDDNDRAGGCVKFVEPEKDRFGYSPRQIEGARTIAGN